MRTQVDLRVGGYGAGDLPPSRLTEQISIECGCSVFIGIRLDKYEPVTVADSCCPEHRPIVVRFNELMTESLADGGSDRELGEVIIEFLEQASHDVRTIPHPGSDALGVAEKGEPDGTA